jgi:carbamoyl-phosphate synthase large subunit
MSPESRGSRARVLVTGVGGPSGVCLLNALAKRPLTLFAGDIDPYAAGLYLLEADRRTILPRGEHERFAERLLIWCERNAIEVVIPTVDCELLPLAQRRVEFERAGVRLVLAPLGTLEACLDKWMLNTLCCGHVQTPETALLDERFEPLYTPLPAIVKPRVGSGSRGVLRIDRVEQFEGLPRDGSLIVQELLPGAEFSLDVLATDAGQVIAVVPRERLKIDSGIAVAGRTQHNGPLQAIGREVAELIGLTGVANVQVKLDAHGHPALLEVNPRFPGTMALTIASGPDMAWLCVAEALGRPMPRTEQPFVDIAMVRVLQEHFLPFEEILHMQDAEPAPMAVPS